MEKFEEKLVKVLSNGIPIGILMLFLLIFFLSGLSIRGNIYGNVGFLALSLGLSFFMTILFNLLLDSTIPKMTEKTKEWALLSIFMTIAMYYFFEIVISRFFVTQLSFIDYFSAPEIFAWGVPLLALTFVFLFRVLMYLSKTSAFKRSKETFAKGFFAQTGLKVNTNINNIKNTFRDLIIGIFFISFFISNLPFRNPETIGLSGNISLTYGFILPIFFAILEIIIWLYLVQYPREISLSILKIGKKVKKKKDDGRGQFFVEGKLVKVGSEIKKYSNAHKKMKKILVVILILSFFAIIAIRLATMPPMIEKEFPVYSYRTDILNGSISVDNLIYAENQIIKDYLFYIQIVEINGLDGSLSKENNQRIKSNILDSTEKEKVFLNLTKTKSFLVLEGPNHSKSEEEVLKTTEKYYYPKFEGDFIYFLRSQGISSFCSITHIRTIIDNQDTNKIYLFEKDGINRIHYRNVIKNPFAGGTFIRFTNESFENETISYMKKRGFYFQNNFTLGEKGEALNYTGMYNECMN